MELGLLLFMAGVGLNAGGGIVEIIQNSGLKLLGAGIDIDPLITARSTSLLVDSIVTT